MSDHISTRHGSALLICMAENERGMAEIILLID